MKQYVPPQICPNLLAWLGLSHSITQLRRKGAIHQSSCRAWPTGSGRNQERIHGTGFRGCWIKAGKHYVWIRKCQLGVLSGVQDLTLWEDPEDGASMLLGGRQ